MGFLCWENTRKILYIYHIFPWEEYWCCVKSVKPARVVREVVLHWKTLTPLFQKADCSVVGQGGHDRLHWSPPLLILMHGSQFEHMRRLTTWPFSQFCHFFKMYLPVWMHMYIKYTYTHFIYNIWCR